MPLLVDTCTPITEQYCSELWRISDHLLCKVFEAVNTCFIPGCDPQLVAFVTTGQGDDGIKDKLTVSLLQIDPSTLTTAVGPGLYRATWIVRLHESGWPIVRTSGDTITPPPPEEQEMAIQQLMAHGEAMHRRLAHMRANKMMTPSGMRCLNSMLGQMTPVFPSGGVAGWEIQVTIDVSWGM